MPEPVARSATFKGERDMRAIGSVREVCEPMWTSSDWSVPGAPTSLRPAAGSIHRGDRSLGATWVRACAGAKVVAKLRNSDAYRVLLAAPGRRRKAHQKALVSSSSQNSRCAPAYSQRSGGGAVEDRGANESSATPRPMPREPATPPWLWPARRGADFLCWGFPGAAR